ncbi:MAG: UDP-N-acetylmuramoyl-tripeptide--D-alanyl-D-alanine ligase [Parachlamydiaceae bacterium]|nr:UDP-N-acetylmuramoyl-tripeptide--D-alanyl-D-alanine ligase [Parachlamydiaceae bacterium]
MKNGIPLKKISALIHSSISSADSFNSSYLAYGACVDSRLLKTGDLFFACSGNRSDGHAFISQAAQKGASAAVVSADYSGDCYGLPLIYVENPEKALQQLAKAVLQSSKTKVVAITGSVGKTTTKGFLAHLLASSFRVAATPGNYNSQLGLPLTILNHLQDDTEVAVLEMGMTKAGHIASLIEIAPPEIAIITATALGHAENFESLEAIGLAKAEILSHPKTRLGIVDFGISNYQAIAQLSCTPLTSFGCDTNHADWALIRSKQCLRLFNHGILVIEFESLSLPGQHNHHNFLAAAVAANSCGISWELIMESAKKLTLPEMRLQIQEHQGITFINDSYNSLPIAVKAALDSLPLPKREGRKIAVLGEMRELGQFSLECHLEVANYALSRIDMLFCLGKECVSMHDLWEKSNREVFWTLEFSELVEQLRKFLRPDDVVLIKGSRTSGLSGLVDKI